MLEAKIIKSDNKGRIILPVNLFGKLKNLHNAKFLVISGDDCVVLKQININMAKEKLNDVYKKVQQKFKEENITKKEVNKAIKWARKSK